MGIEYLLCRSSVAYSAHLANVALLFTTVFHRKFPGDGWRQWYLENPYGEPLVALGYCGERLVGHHALIPQNLECGGTAKRYYLSMSTMVHPAYRGSGAFIQMVDMLHEEALEARAPFILAFPNATSAPLFEKVFGYSPILHTELCNWMYPWPLARIDGDTDPPPEEEIGLHTYPTDQKYWSWRTERTRARRPHVGESLDIVYKVIEPGTLMVLDVRVGRRQGSAADLAQFADSLGLTAIRLTRYHASALDIPDTSLTPHEGYIVRLYGLPLAETVPVIRFRLLLSDVF